MLAAGCRRCSPGLAAGLDSGAPKIGTGLRLPGGGLHCAGPAQRDHRIDARVGGEESCQMPGGCLRGSLRRWLRGRDDAGRVASRWLTQTVLPLASQTTAGRVPVAQVNHGSQATRGDVFASPGRRADPLQS